MILALAKTRPACFCVSFNAGSTEYLIMDKSRFFGRACAVAATALPFAAFAEGEQTNAGVTAALGELNTLSTSVGQYVTGAAPVVGTILASVLGITLLFVGWKLVRRATNKA